MKRKFSGYMTEEGAIKWDHPRSTFDALKGKRFEASPVKRKRSTSLNKYYWGAIIEALMDLTGYTREECHEILKARFFPKHIVAVEDGSGNIRGEFTIGASTTQLDNQEFMEEYCRDIRVWFASFNPPIRIPLPNGKPDDIWPGPEHYTEVPF